MKGLVMKESKEYVVLFDESCGFIKVQKQPGMYVGLEVNYYKEDILKEKNRYKYIAVMTSIAAVFIFMILKVNMFSTTTRYSYVDVDIGNTYEICLDKELKVTTVNKIEDDKLIKQELNLKNKSVEEVILKLFNINENIEVMRNIDEEVILLSMYSNQSYKNIRTRLDTIEKISGDLNSLFDKDISIKVVDIKKDDRIKALENRMSMGRYALYKKNIDNGINLKINDVKNIAISKIINMTEINNISTINTQNTTPTPKQSKEIVKIDPNIIVQDIEKKAYDDKNAAQSAANIVINNINQNEKIGHNDKQRLIDGIRESTKMKVDMIENEKQQKINMVLETQNRTPNTEQPNQVPGFKDQYKPEQSMSPQQNMQQNMPQQNMPQQNMPQQNHYNSQEQQMHQNGYR